MSGTETREAVLPDAYRTITASPAKDRLPALDILRGLAMVLMALDHSRDFFSNSAAVFAPTDLSRTTPLLFLTRWITHFCAPVFIFLAGTGAYLWQEHGRETCELAKYLATRGLWLILFEIFVISPLGWSFSFTFGFTRLQVIWVIGVAGLLLIVVHNLFDGPHAAWLRDGEDAWRALHQPTFFHLSAHHVIASLYPVAPWVGVMMAGYAAGEFMTWPATRRRKILVSLGAAGVSLFVFLRSLNFYGDPSHWSHQG